MAIIDTERDVIVIRIVYDGPPFSGKTTSIHALGNLLGENNPVFSPEESDGKTLYFDWMEYIGGLFKGYGISCQIISVPGQLSLEERRHFLLRTADAVIFVLDAGEKKTEIPLLYFKDLQNILSPQLNEETVKVVIQANKQDKPNAFSSEQLKKEVFYNYPEIKIIESIATVGKGVRETFVLAVRHAVERADALMVKEQLASGKPDITNGEELLSVLQKTITLKPVTSDTDVVVQTPAKESEEQLAEESIISFEDLDVSEPKLEPTEEHSIETSEEKRPIEDPIVPFEDLDVSEPESKFIEEHPIETFQEKQLVEESIISFEDLDTSESKSESTERSSETFQEKQLVEESIVSFEDSNVSEPESKSVEEQLIETYQPADNSIIIENKKFFADETREPVDQLLEQPKEQLAPEDLDLSRKIPELTETVQSDDKSEVEVIEQTLSPTEEVKKFDKLNLETSQKLLIFENQPTEKTEKLVRSKDELEVESVNLSNEEATNLVENEVPQQLISSDEENWESFEENTCELPEPTISFEHLAFSNDEASQIESGVETPSLNQVETPSLNQVETPSLNQNEIENMRFVIVSDKELDEQTEPTSDDEPDDEVEEFFSNDDELLYISDEEFEEYISFDGEFKESSLFDQEFFVLPDELEKTPTLPEELEGVNDNVLPEDEEIEAADEINLPPPIEVENQPDLASPAEVSNQSVSFPSFSGKKQLPKFPDEDTPIQWIWPPLFGSQILESLFKQALRPHLQPDGTWVINTKNDWRCFSKWHWSYSTAEQARERLRANMRMHLQCSPFLSEQRCVAVAYDALKETWRLWQIVRMELSLAEYLVKALQEERVEKLVLETIKCASRYVEALQQSTRYPHLLELSLENIGLDEEQKLIYLGCIEEENATQTIQPSLNQETLSEIITMVFADPIIQIENPLEAAAIVKVFDQLSQVEPPYLIELLKNLFLNRQT